MLKILTHAAHVYTIFCEDNKLGDESIKIYITDGDNLWSSYIDENCRKSSRYSDDIYVYLNNIKESLNEAIGLNQKYEFAINAKSTGDLEFIIKVLNIFYHIISFKYQFLSYKGILSRINNKNNVIKIRFTSNIK
jgi:hypothetical protein